MLTISGYTIRQKLYESETTLVCRGRRKADNLPVILKLLKQTYPTPGRITRFKREYELLCSLREVVGVVHAYNLETDQQEWLMVQEDFDGDSLTRLGITGRIELCTFLILAIQVADILGQIHQHHIIHKDLNPSNILYNPETEQVKITDFSIATTFSPDSLSASKTNMLEGTLAYISPEQTGRLDHALDYRTDFYSLGATLYELLTGQPPFPTNDTLELVHSHIARNPSPIHEHRPDTPPMIHKIILKLMAKNPADRYQSAYGLRADLEECLRQWNATGQIASFPPGQYDNGAGGFRMLRRLYGRSREISTILRIFEQVNQGANHTIMVTGYVGIGKTTLVHELQQPITNRGGYFVTGKFDQFQRNTPYLAIIQAFSSLVRHLLTESAETIARWRQRLLAALGPNGQVITEVIPDVQLIIGEQPAVPVLGPTEAQNRFNLVFHQFITVFAQPHHPLVLFLDDLQWADAVSLKCMERLITATDRHSLLLIGAYRDHEVDETHMLHHTLENITQAGATIHTIALKPLDVPVVTQIVAEALPCALEHARPLAEVMVARTGGNPFSLSEFLKLLFNEGLLMFDYNHHTWLWDLDRVRAHEISDNMIELMTNKVQRVAPETQHLLRLAACIGNQFDLVTLAVVAEQTTGAVVHALQPALNDGLVLPRTSSYTLIVPGVNGNEDEVVAEYSFAHDRIQQAVYAMLPEEQRRMVHRQVGQVLLWSMPPTEREDHIFAIVYQLNQCHIFLANQEDRDELAELNLLAGRRAKAATAHEAAFGYLSLGIELLGSTNEHASSTTPPEQTLDAPWQRHYTLTLELYQEAIEAAYLLGRFEQMDRMVTVVLRQIRSILDLIPIYETRILAYVARNMPLEAVTAGLQILEVLDVTFAENPQSAEVLPGLAETQALLVGKRIEELAALPHITDPGILAAMRILLSITNAAYNTIPDVFLLFVFKQVNISIEYGNAPVSAFAYANYGRILCGMLGDIAAGYTFGQLALHLLETFNAKELYARTYVVVYHFIIHWQAHVRDTLRYSLAAYQSGLETGDLEFATLAVQGYAYLAFFSGQDLGDLEQEMQRHRETLTQLHQGALLTVQRICHQAVLNLMKKSDNVPLLRGRHYNEEKMLPLHLAAKERTTLYFFYVHKLILCYLFGAYEQACDNADLAAPYETAVTGLFVIPVCIFYDSLARLALLGSTEAHNEATLSSPPDEHLHCIAANQERLQQWARHAPMNHLHRWYLVEAERARLAHRDGEAWEHYHQAIELAQEHGYQHEEALALERVAHFYQAKALNQFAGSCIQDAYYAYLRWGAIAKARALEAEYPQFLAQVVRQQSTPPVEPSVDYTVQRLFSTLDLTSVVRASQAISDDIVLDTLLSKLITIVIENAGAERGVLILLRQGQWVIEAEGAVHQTQVKVLQSIPVTAFPETPLLPLSIIHYVVNTKRYVVLHDATNTGQFTSDHYVLKHQPKSVLCMPLLNQGTLTGMLYLENNLTTGVFTPAHLEVLNLLSAQAAISIEKARLYTNLEAALAQQVALTRAYSRFVPREILQFLGKDSIIQVKLGDQIHQVMTILFSDIRNFTTLSEQMSPQENFNFLNSYLSRVSPIIREQNGFIDKYIGDAIMAIFPGQPDDALQAAINMQREVTLYNTHRDRQGYQPISIGIGLHTGSVMLGTIGETERMEGTVISDGVNLASRLEGLTKLYGASILVSERTLAQTMNPQHYQVRLLGTVRVKGKQEAVAMCEILDGYPPEVLMLRIATRDMFEEGLRHYSSQEFGKAVECFKWVLEHDSSDRAARLYMHRAGRFGTYGVPMEWEGFEEVTEK